MRVILHQAYVYDIASMAVSIGTGYPVSHASIVQGDEVWDSNMARGYLDINTFPEHEMDRTIMVFDFPQMDAKDFLLRNRGRKYDFLGIALWFLHIHSKDRWYCFELISECLRENGIEVMPKNHAVTGKVLFDFFTKDLGLIGKTGNTRQLLQGVL
ncbi:hypothetical protein Peetri_00115 [Pseudomonas phage vB_PpuM-Peetri]